MISRQDSFARVTALAFTLTFFNTPAFADTFTIDDGTAGSVYDGTIDGFPLPPPGTPPNGVGDLTGNPIGVALQTGVTEQRGVIELPLASLAGIDPSDVESATLSLNIDDVISTFGPGTTFDGGAADTLIVFGYAGNGAISAADDFDNVAGAPLGVIDTTPHGVITDATLAVSGPLAFDVDVTAALTNLLIAETPFMGFVIVTDDAGSGTSLDNLGNGGAGPAGVNGSLLPYLTIVTASGVPPVFGKEELGCQKAIAKAGSKYLGTVRKSLTKCMDGVLAIASKGDDPATMTDKCTSAADPASSTSTVGKATFKVVSSITGACTGLTPAAVSSPCNESATTFEQVAACVITGHTDLAAQSVADSYADGCAVLSAVGLDDDYPAVCD
jgi:hypothetical protein